MGEGERETVECSGSKCVREEGELSGRRSWLVREGEDQEPASGDLEKKGFGEEAVGKGETLRQSLRVPRSLGDSGAAGGCGLKMRHLRGKDSSQFRKLPT